MNKHILAIAITGATLVSLGRVASAHDNEVADPRFVDPRVDSYQQSYDPRDNDHEQVDHRGGGLGYELDHLNGMLAHMQRELRRYGADGHILREYQHVRAEAYQVSNQFRRGEQFYNRRRLRGEVEHMHNELHHIEQELHVRADEWYRWR